MLHIARKRGDYSVANVVINACEVKGIKLETIKNDVSYNYYIFFL